ncbi:multiple epidermal growth factor-like domains protein 10 isoform X1 [Saccostrea cucullata]|uniref:multiple epidermal growth factor-like domains protein 10 isoform X1 n=1 Tax=Saccostrea cuccullata TaxID=36930 RepID=UPI002ED3D2DB
MTGICVNGCSKGFYGDKCITECPLGYYGFNCTSVCSKTCSTPSVCDRFTGTCFDGCLTGFSGDRCLNDDGFRCPSLVYILFFVVLLFVFVRKKKGTTNTADSSKDISTFLKKDMI